MSRQIKVVRYDPQWQQAFSAEAALIVHTLAPLRVQTLHIGSTAIPGIFAKPVIDVLLIVEQLVALDGRSDRLTALGYEGLGEYGIPGRRYFRKSNRSGIRTHQVHAFAENDPSVERHLAFRDYLIAHPEEAQAYSELKRVLAHAFPADMSAYMHGKDAFVKERESRAIAWQRSLHGHL